MAWDNPGVGKFLLFMFLQGLLFMAVVLALEMSVFTKLVALIKVSSTPCPAALSPGRGVS